MPRLMPPNTGNIFKRQLCVFLFTTVFIARLSAQESLTFTVDFDEQAFSEPFTGDLFIALAEGDEPRASMHRWFNPPPIARFKVEGVAPGQSITLDLSEAKGKYPPDWSEVKGKQWSLQAVARVNLFARKAGTGAGDVYSEPATTRLENGDAVALRLDRVVEPEPFQETKRIRLFSMTSPSLSAFHGADYQIQAGVILPRDYDPDGTYPVLYDIPGFGGTHRNIHRKLARLNEDSPLHRCIVVVPDPSNRYGHSVFCNSKSIGPWGTALTEELIPKLERQFGGAGAGQRYVTGVSSGGWSCLYLQITFPEHFAGCWSHVPDPIDFHDFQQINLYDPLPDGTARNMYTDAMGMARPLARRGDQVTLTYEQFVRREHVTNPGGQIRSFEATFSPPAEDGSPKRVFDVQTGRIDHTVAQTWREYDLSHLLLTRWDELKDDLAGKIHIFAGEKDTFYLNGAVERFQRLARKAEMLDEIEVKIIPGMAHSLYKQGQQQMLDVIASRLEPVAAQ